MRKIMVLASKEIKSHVSTTLFIEWCLQHDIEVISSHKKHGINRYTLLKSLLILFKEC